MIPRVLEVAPVSAGIVVDSEPPVVRVTIETLAVIGSPSRDKTRTSVFCHIIGTVSQSAKVLLVISHVVRALCEGSRIETPEIGIAAGQTLVKVCPTNSWVVHPWAVKLVELPTQDQLLTTSAFVINRRLRG